jgi:hypothetical protein
MGVLSHPHWIGRRRRPGVKVLRKRQYDNYPQGGASNKQPSHWETPFGRVSPTTMLAESPVSVILNYASVSAALSIREALS